MDLFHITYHKLNGNILELNTKEKIMNFEDFYIILEDRSLKQDFSYQPEIIKSENGLTNIQLDISKIDFNKNEKNVLDLFFIIGNKKYRVQSDFIHLKTKKSRYSTNFYMINTSEVAVPYLTINNNLSILYGNASKVFNEYCEPIESINFVNYTSSKKDQFISLEFPSIPFSKNTTFLAFYDDEKKSYVTLSYIQDKENSNKIFVDLQKNPVYKNGTEALVLQQKKRNILTTLKLDIQPNSDKQTNNRELYFTEKTVIKSHLNIDNLTYNHREISFELDESLLNDTVNYDLYIKDKNDKIYTPEIEFKKTDGKTTIKADLSEFIKKHTIETSKWDFYLNLEYQYYIEENRLGIYDSPYIPVYNRYLDHKDTENHRSITPYLTINNGLSIIITSKVSLDNRILKPIIYVTNLKKESRKKFSGEVSLELEECENYKVSALLLKYRSKTDDIEYNFDINEQIKENNKSFVRFNIDISDLKFEQFQWDVFLQISIDENNYLIRIKNPLDNLRESISNEENKYIIKPKKHFIFHPYITLDDGLSFTYREKEKYETTWMQIKERFAYFTYNIFKKYFDRKKIWLVYEKFSQTAQDNSFYFFKYVYNNHPEENIYYIIDKNSSDYKNLKEMKNRVIPFMSVKYFIYLFASKLLISSESKGHAYILRKQNGRMRNAINNKKFIFLQHGVTAFKKVDAVFGKNSKNKVDIFVTSSDWEADIVENNFGYNKDEIVVTGFSRWDALVDKSQNNNKKKIMVMPTWRSWLDGVTDEKFIESDYYLNYKALLNSDKLQELLRDNEITIDFIFHPKFKEYVDNFRTNSENIKIYQFGEESINKLLMQSNLLITDYSSVAWDQYYQKKPVIFYQFDYNIYDQIQGSYMNMNTDLFGDRVFEVDQLIQTIETYVDRDFAEKEEYATMRNKYFKYSDRNNSKRIFNKIIENKEYLNLK